MHGTQARLTDFVKAAEEGKHEAVRLVIQFAPHRLEERGKAHDLADDTGG